ncbi:MAG: proprotein convertase P-domain-containing protein [Saprospiraceae bacterium]|nr:proprotein convertase P-domain-containing protein [Saprospiraceae bacterium]
MRKLSLFILFCFACLGGALAQKPWQAVLPEQVALPDGAQRHIEPLKYTAYKLDFQSITNQLAGAPVENSAAARQSAFTAEFPMADGQMERFSVFQVATMEPELAARRSEIRTYAGRSLNTAGKSIRITLSPYRGFEAVVLLADKGVEYIEPVADGQVDWYMAYHQKDLPKGMWPTNARATYLTSKEWIPEPPSRYTPGAPAPADRSAEVTPVQIKVYRFACATTGEFAQDHGGTVASTLAKVVSTTNLLNAIYERDINIRLQLIAEEESIIFTDPDTDPYTGTTVGEWMAQNPFAMINVLGTASKYDIGHVFARYKEGGAIGVAGGIGCTDTKGRGCSAWYGPPYGDGLFGVVGQEIGHQWRGGHTFNQCFSDSQFTYDSACEPGSGSTIMSYAGACGSNNVVGQAALYYHACSIAEIRYFVENQEGATCGTTQTMSNQKPTAQALHPDGLFIPISTPFRLRGTGTDPDGDPLTFCWDEIDVGPTAALGSPVSTSPLFAWKEPDTSATRYFPRLTNLNLGINSATEILPTYSRDINFVLVARDNKPDGGGVDMDTLRLRSTVDAGPFRVTYPSSAGITMKSGDYQVITWDVANTDGALVNCKKVSIRLSVNGGNTYPYLLASGVPNTGSCCVKIPDGIFNAILCRIWIEADDNVFFDISNSSFKIQAATAPSFGMCVGDLDDLACLPSSYSTEISTSALSGFTDPITLSVDELPAGATATFSVNPVQPGGSSVVTLTFPNNLAEGIDSVAVHATSGATSITRKIALKVVRNFFNGLALSTPVNGANGVSLSPWLRWVKTQDANLYEVQLASSPSFAAGTILASSASVAIDSFKVPIFLSEGQTCYWRVRPLNECGPGAWTTPNAFVTKVESCNTYTSTDVPKVISANGTPTVECKIIVPGGGAVSDINISEIQGEHAYFKDLELRLVAPNGSNSLLFKDRCGSYNGGFFLGFDDSANTGLTCPPSQTGAKFKSTEPLANLVGQPAAGTWILRVKDNAVSSGGQIQVFKLELCSSVTLNPPTLVKNLPLNLPAGQNASIGNDLLQVTDANTPASSLVFTLLTTPRHGGLQRDWTGDAKVGDQFTQADIDNGAMRYFDWALNQGQDDFRFAVTDGEGGLIVGTFVISPDAVSTDEPATLAFDVSPNPTEEIVRVNFGEALTDDVQLAVLDATGRLLSTQVLPAGTLTQTLNLKSLPSGVYTLALNSKRLTGVKRVVKQ